MQDLGVLAAGETPSAEDSALVLLRWNRFIDRLKTERLAYPYPQTRTTWTIAANDGSYTVGSGADVNVARPIFLDHLAYIDTSVSSSQEYPIIVTTDDAWARVVDKALTSTYPTMAHYNPTFPTGTLDIWPVPTLSTLTGVMYAPSAIAEFSALTDTVSIPPGYNEFFVTNLAVFLAASFQAMPSPALLQMARESKEAIQAANLRMSDLAFDGAALIQGYPYGRGYSIRTDN